MSSRNLSISSLARSLSRGPAAPPSSEDPKALRRNLEPLVARWQCARAIGTQPQLAAVEQVFPAIAQEHRRDERQPDGVLAFAARQPHALEADHSGCRSAGCGGRAARLAPQAPPFAGE